MSVCSLFKKRNLFVTTPTKRLFSYVKQLRRPVNNPVKAKDQFANCFGELILKKEQPFSKIW